MVERGRELSRYIFTTSVRESHIWSRCGHRSRCETKDPRPSPTGADHDAESLCDDVPWPERAVEEHDSFARVLRPDRDVVRAEQEQWNDAYNVLAVAPGAVVAYQRNRCTNDYLSSVGIEVIAIAGNELGRGRGGPRFCPVRWLASQRTDPPAYSSSLLPCWNPHHPPHYRK